MGIDITQKPEQNVVNVGDEISGDQLAAIQSASNPSAVNPFATMNDVGGGGGSFDQSLNTTDSVVFASVTGGDAQLWYALYPSLFQVSDASGVNCEIWGNFQVGEGGLYINDNNAYTQTSITNNGIKFADGTMQTTAAGSISVVEADGSGAGMDPPIVGGTYNYLTATNNVNVSIYVYSFSVGQVAYIASDPTSGGNVVFINTDSPSNLTTFGFPIGATPELYAGQVAKIIRVNDDTFGVPTFHAILL